MQSSAKPVSTAVKSSKPSASASNFSSYVNKNLSPPSNSLSWAHATTENSWSNGGGLPPPPTACAETLSIEPKSVPPGPAKAWSLDLSDEELSDEGKPPATSL